MNEEWPGNSRPRRSAIVAPGGAILLLLLLASCCIPFGDSNNCGETRPGVAYDCDAQSCQRSGRIEALFCVEAGDAATEQARLQTEIDAFVHTCRTTCTATQACSATRCVRSGACPIPN